MQDTDEREAFLAWLYECLHGLKLGYESDLSWNFGEGTVWASKLRDQIDDLEIFIRKLESEIV